MNKKTKNISTRYLVEIVDNLTEKERGILNYFYLPLIGSQAFSLYCFLISEVETIEENKSNQMPFEKLEAFLNLTNSEIWTASEKLKEYKLLEIHLVDSRNLILHLFTLKKPVLVTEFFKNEKFHTNFEKKIPNMWIEKIYTKFKKIKLISNHDFVDKKINLSANENLAKKVPCQIFADFPNLEFPFFIWTKNEKNMVELLKKKYQLSNNILRILINYILRKNNGQRMGAKYLSSIVQDLEKKGFLQNEKKIQLHFSHIETNLRSSEIVNDTKKINHEINTSKIEKVDLKFPGLFK